YVRARRRRRANRRGRAHRAARAGRGRGRADGLPRRGGGAVPRACRAHGGAARGDRGAHRAGAHHRRALARVARPQPGDGIVNRRVIAVPVVLALVGLGAWLAFRPGGDDAGALEASGTVEATEADLGFQVGGRIAEISVREGDRVEAGALLARLAGAELAARLVAAEAQLDAARQVLRELERGARPEELRQAEAAEAAARQRMEEAARMLA